MQMGHMPLSVMCKAFGSFDELCKAAMGADSTVMDTFNPGGFVYEHLGGKEVQGCFLHGRPTDCAMTALTIGSAAFTGGTGGAGARACLKLCLRAGKLMGKTPVGKWLMKVPDPAARAQSAPKANWRALLQGTVANSSGILLSAAGCSIIVASINFALQLACQFAVSGGGNAALALFSRGDWVLGGAIGLLTAPIVAPIVYQVRKWKEE
jgi:hypothetical protein